MGTRKSRIDEEFYVNLLHNVLVDAYRAFPEISSHELTRDMMSIRARVTAEGFGFLSKTLPSLDRALLLGIETGQLIVPPGFARKSKHRCTWNIPVLFSELFLTIFDREGNLVCVKNTAVAFIRQLCLTCYKVESPFSDDQLERASRKYKDIERELPDGQLTVREDQRGVIRRARFLLRRLFSGFKPWDVTPRHGPGSVAERGVRGRNKYVPQFYSQSLDLVYPYVQFITFGFHSQNSEDLLGYRTLDRSIAPARVVFVPKDSRGPRVISCEPAQLQFLQQGLAREIVSLVRKHPLTRGRVYFNNQRPHRERARRASIDGRYATIDLADASDRVSSSLVRALFPEDLLPYLFATRSQTAQLPDGSLVTLKKFAPMGSALCFPIEALVFWALCQGAVWDVSRVNGALRTDNVFVFGDDIICRSTEFERITTVLESFGLKVNRSKCFYRGLFRESCGADVFNGEDVTPTRLRALVCRARPVFRDVYRLSKNAQSFFDKGYWSTAEYLWKACEKIVGPLPTMGSRFRGICRTSTLLPTAIFVPHGMKTRWQKDLCRNEIKTRYLKSRREKSPFPSGVARFVHNLCEGMREPYAESVAVPHTALPKAGWVPIM